jgi:hypothetical protein
LTPARPGPRDGRHPDLRAGRSGPEAMPAGRSDGARRMAAGGWPRNGSVPPFVLHPRSCPCRDKALDDTAAADLALQRRLKVI